MSELGKDIRNRCHVNTNDEDDRFVGVKADTDGAKIYFPIGYRLPENDNDLRLDITKLFNVLSDFSKEDKLIESSDSAEKIRVDFPINAYLYIIHDFLRIGKYFIETDPKYKTDTKGNTSWSRTIKEIRALVQKNGSFIYNKMIVRSVTPNADKEITQIHRYCVYEAFDKMGWLYVPFMPEKPGRHPSIQESMSILSKKIKGTQNDENQKLFSSMLSMLNYVDKRSSDKQYFFGTHFFEKIWEKMIDRAFGIPDKEQYFPRASWYMDYGKDKKKNPLIPDTIMKYNNKVYILDAKFYRYACCNSNKSNLLPNTSDINKQITYGKYIEKNQHVPVENLYNAFIMPFNCKKNFFTIKNTDGKRIPDIIGYIGNVGEAIGDWTPSPKKYERIQAIVMDTRYLMHHYDNMPSLQKQKLAEAIEKVDSRGPISK